MIAVELNVLMSRSYSGNKQGFPHHDELAKDDPVGIEFIIVLQSFPQARIKTKAKSGNKFLRLYDYAFDAAKRHSTQLYDRFKTAFGNRLNNELKGKLR